MLPALKRLVDPATRGDPEGPLRWVSISTRSLATQLRAEGHRVSHATVGQLLHALGYSMQANRKKAEGAVHPDRDAQFRYINAGAAAFIDAGDAVLSVDTKKKEILANYKAAGQRWEPKGQPTEVDTHDFPYPHLGRAIPYGIYELGANHGFVSVGISHDTATFSANALRSWWTLEGAARYADADRILITADCGGSNARSSRVWKVELADFAAAIDRPVHVRHFPPGTSKWNKIEHRLFAPISNGMRARPPVDLATVVGVIGATTTSTGLDVTVHLDEADYPKGVKVSNKQMRALPLTRDAWHPEWNYTLHPR